MISNRAVTFAPASRVAVVGGTHGNEMSGIFLTRHWLKNPSELQRSTLTVTPLLANQPAVERCVRYIDQDLNCCFTPSILQLDSKEALPLEVCRAKELNCLLGSRGSEEGMHLIIDLHNTTANIGNCLIFNNSTNHFCTHMASYIQRTLEDYECKVLALELEDSNLYDLTSVARHDLGVELGPQPHGVIRAENMERMRKIVKTALDFVEMFNKGVDFPERDLVIYRFVRNMDFPRDADGEISAVIHPERQDRDWLPLHPGDPIFLTLGGHTIQFDGDHTVYPTVYPTFINESAYYEKKTAFSVTEKVTIRLPPIHRHREGATLGEGASQ